MGLFDAIVGSIADPNQKTGAGDLAGLLTGLQQLAGGRQQQAGAAGGGDMQAVVAALGGHVKSALQRIEQSPTSESAADVVGAMATQNQTPQDLIEHLFGRGGAEQVAGDVGQKTGMNMQAVMAMLPVVLPLVMKLLNSGGPSQGGEAQPSGASGLAANPVLKGFLDSDQDGDVDLADVLKLAGPFLAGKTKS